MKKSIRDPRLDFLFNAILTLQDIDDCYEFFEDLCTIKEVGSMAQRLQVAAMLKEGVTYHEIVEKTGASTATISRVNRAYHYGAGGYKTILKRIDGESK